MVMLFVDLQNLLVVLDCTIDLTEVFLSNLGGAEQKHSGKLRIV
jgi:hypothetical protein